jgi:secretion/DNA translocation related TadE-like protein
MTPGDDDLWSRRRRLGEMLRRWATPARSGAPESPAEPPFRTVRRRGFCQRLRRARRDRGAATVFVVAVGLVLVLVGVAGAAVGAARVGRHRAQAAADLGALAGAVRAIEGTEVACARASRFVAANGGRATSCEVIGLEIVLRTEVTITPLPKLTRHATAAARAGPVYAATSRTTATAPGMPKTSNGYDE